MKYRIFPINQSCLWKNVYRHNIKGQGSNTYLKLTWFNKVESFDPSWIFFSKIFRTFTVLSVESWNGKINFIHHCKKLFNNLYIYYLWLWKIKKYQPFEVKKLFHLESLFSSDLKSWSSVFRQLNQHRMHTYTRHVSSQL